MIGIVDYGIGNVGSILNMYKRLGIEAMLVSLPDQVNEVKKLILPGVGAFDTGMGRLRKAGFEEALSNNVLNEGKPILGICLGAQMLFEKSEEGELPGLGWIRGKVVKFDKSRLNGLKVPHMGWTDIKVINENSLLNDFHDNPRFYFVHSYHFMPERNEDILATCNYGYEFPCAVQKGNVYGAQFHPEKSHKFGMQVLKNFAEKC